MAARKAGSEQASAQEGSGFEMRGCRRRSDCSAALRHLGASKHKQGKEGTRGRRARRTQRDEPNGAEVCCSVQHISVVPPSRCTSRVALSDLPMSDDLEAWEKLAVQEVQEKEQAREAQSPTKASASTRAAASEQLRAAKKKREEERAAAAAAAQAAEQAQEQPAAIAGWGFLAAWQEQASNENADPRLRAAMQAAVTAAVKEAQTPMASPQPKWRMAANAARGVPSTPMPAMAALTDRLQALKAEQAATGFGPPKGQQQQRWMPVTPVPAPPAPPARVMPAKPAVEHAPKRTQPQPRGASGASSSVAETTAIVAGAVTAGAVAIGSLVMMPFNVCADCMSGCMSCMCDDG